MFGPQWALWVGDPAGAPDDRLAHAIAVHALDALPAAAARQLIAALRDRVARHVLLVVDLSRAALTDNDLRALGFRLHRRDRDQALFGFDLYDYKDRPEWLNPRHWAHPELWDRFRW